MLEVFIGHRLEVVRRRSAFRRRKAEERLHLVEGLLIAILDIDEVIALIRSSDDAAAARARLIQVFDLSEAQATYILDMPLRRLTKFSRIELEAERDELRARIAELTEILDDDKRLRRVVGDELSAVAQDHGTPRRTVLLEASAAPVRAAVPLEVADETRPELDWWRYRRIVSQDQWDDGRADVTLVNWAQNDYALQPLLDGPLPQAQVQAAARELSQCLLQIGRAHV